MVLECNDAGVLDRKSGPYVIDADDFDVSFTLGEPILASCKASLGKRIEEEFDNVVVAALSRRRLGDYSL
jgi:predicted AAA+ superfamily ATPase